MPEGTSATHMLWTLRYLYAGPEHAARHQFVGYLPVLVWKALVD